MCVLIYKPSGINMPSRKILKACYKANPHGAGFATIKGVHHSMRFREIYKGLKSIPIEENCIIHFRLATTGSICLRNCHPFKKGDVFFAHNGVLSIPTKNDMTDSETAFLGIYPDIARYGLDSFEVSLDIRSIIGTSRFAIMQGDKVNLYGKFTCIDGVYYSNTRWQYFM